MVLPLTHSLRKSLRNGHGRSWSWSWSWGGPTRDEWQARRVMGGGVPRPKMNHDQMVIIFYFDGVPYEPFRLAFNFGSVSDQNASLPLVPLRSVWPRAGPGPAPGRGRTPLTELRAPALRDSEVRLPPPLSQRLDSETRTLAPKYLTKHCLEQHFWPMPVFGVLERKRRKVRFGAQKYAKRPLSHFLGQNR